MKPIVTLCALAVVLFGMTVTIVAQELSPEEVRKAIAGGVSYLKTTQKADGSWSEYSGAGGLSTGHVGGVSGLAMLALLNAGVDLQDPAIVRGLKYMRNLRPEKTYTVSLQTMVLCRADPAADQALIGRNVTWLEKYQIAEGTNRGAWAYPAGAGDGSNSQFALLALHEAARLTETGQINVQVSHRTWELARLYWSKGQNANGSWSYYPSLGASAGTGSMTAAGIACLVISSDMIQTPDARVVGNRVDCCARSDSEHLDQIENGIDWIRRNYTVESNPGSGQMGRLWHYYYLYALERVGRLTARRFIGNHDWYREGTLYLVKRQDRLSGFWQGGGHSEDDRNIATSMALLFLTKGRRPVVVAKIKHGPAEHWNRRRSDVHNLVLYVESRWKRELSWQAVDLEAATIDDLLQSPVLYYCGNLTPLPPTEDRRRTLAEKLRGYIDRGGFLFAEGDGCSNGFDEGFRELMALVFPEPEYRLKRLDPGHPVWHAEEQVKPEQVRPLLGIDFGCRTSVIYAPPDTSATARPSLSCLWELSRSGHQQRYPRAIQDQIDGGRAIGINVLAYATNREVKDRFEIPQKIVGPKLADESERGRLEVAKLKHSGGCDAAPRALANLLEAAAGQLKTNLRINPRAPMIAPTDEALFNYPIVFMHGRNAFRFTKEEQAALRTYIDRGGVLFADSICSSPQFIESFRREMTAIFPKNPLERIPAGDPMWTDRYGGFNLQSVTRRDPQPAVAGGPLRTVARKVPPELEGVKLGDHYGVIFSPFDLSCALEKHDSLECRGYTREDAARIGLNVLLYAVQE